jgi:DNA-binding NarL/FixJ family response regulator
MEVVGYATSGGQALALAPKSDVILINTRMSDGAALKLSRAIADAELPTKVLVLGLAESKEQILSYVQAGAASYVLKDESVDDLLERIRVAHTGRRPVSPKIAGALMSRFSEHAQLVDDVENGVGEAADLTLREQEILELMGQGLTNKEIAEQLVIDVGTVKHHIHSIRQKLDASSRNEAAAYLALLD